MQLAEIDPTTEETFFKCLHDELPTNEEVMAMRHRWRNKYEPLGHRAKILKDDDGTVVGLTNYIPIEHSPFAGKDLMAILCMWIHGYEHLVGNQQSRGYGRFMLSEIERDARESGCKGVAVWGKDQTPWNPISFYLHMGYRQADRHGDDVLAWKPFSEDAEAPALLKHKPIPLRDDTKVVVTNFVSGWCGDGCHQCVHTREAVADIEDKVDLQQIWAGDKPVMKAHGASFDSVFINGEAFRPDGPPWRPEELRTAILDTYEKAQNAEDLQ